MASRMFSAVFCSIARTSSGTLGRKRIFFTGCLIALAAANLVHGEAEIGDHLFERNTLAALFEIVSRGRDRAAILVGQFLFVVDDDFEQPTHDSQLISRQPF